MFTFRSYTSNVIPDNRVDFIQFNFFLLRQQHTRCMKITSKLDRNMNTAGKIIIEKKELKNAQKKFFFFEMDYC